MTLEQHEACATLRSANRYLLAKSFSGDNAVCVISFARWQTSLTVAVALIDSCISSINLEAANDNR